MSHCLSVSIQTGARECASTAVVVAVAAAAEMPMEELPPLYSVLDPDALDDLFDGTRPRTDLVRVEFAYAGYHVEVADGTVTVTDDPSSDGETTLLNWTSSLA